MATTPLQPPSCEIDDTEALEALLLHVKEASCEPAEAFKRRPKERVLAVYVPEMREQGWVGSFSDAVFLCAWMYFQDRYGRAPGVVEFAKHIYCHPSTVSRTLVRLREKGLLIGNEIAVPVAKLLKDKNQRRIPLYKSYLQRVGGWHHLSSALLLKHAEYWTARLDEEQERDQDRDDEGDDEHENDDEEKSARIQPNVLALDSISRQLAIPKRTIQRARDRLKEFGLLVVESVGRLCRWGVKSLEKWVRPVAEKPLELESKAESVMATPKLLVEREVAVGASTESTEEKITPEFPVMKSPAYSTSSLEAEPWVKQEWVAAYNEGWLKVMIEEYGEPCQQALGRAFPAYSPEDCQAAFVKYCKGCVVVESVPADAAHYLIERATRNATRRVPLSSVVEAVDYWLDDYRKVIQKDEVVRRAAAESRYNYFVRCAKRVIQEEGADAMEDVSDPLVAYYQECALLSKPAPNEVLKRYDEIYKTFVLSCIQTYQRVEKFCGAISSELIDWKCDGVVKLLHEFWDDSVVRFVDEIEQTSRLYGVPATSFDHTLKDSSKASNIRSYITLAKRSGISEYFDWIHIMCRHLAYHNCPHWGIT